MEKKIRVKKDDMVMVQTGKDKGKVGKVLKVIAEKSMVIVSGVNMVKKHQKPTKQYQHGGIIEKENPLYVDKVMLVCPKCNMPTRIGNRTIDDVNVRICKKCEEIVDKT